MNSKQVLYFLIAAIPVFSNVKTAPANWWEGAQLIAAVVGAGCIALKALQSIPDSPPPPTPEPPKTLSTPTQSIITHA